MRRSLRFGPLTTIVLLAIYAAIAFEVIRRIDCAFSPFMFHIH